MIAELAKVFHRVRRLFSRRFWAEALLGPRRNQDQPGVLLVQVSDHDDLSPWIRQGYTYHPLESAELEEPMAPPRPRWPLLALWHIPALRRAVRYGFAQELRLSEAELRLCLGEPVVHSGLLGRAQLRRLRGSLRQIHARHYRAWFYSDTRVCLPEWVRRPDRPLTVSFLHRWAHEHAKQENLLLESVEAVERQGDELRVMVYNVHACVGTDGRLSPQRIAEVIARYDPDVIALQELDQERPRSHGKDQAEEIAGYLAMHHRFHAAMELRRGQYGNAVLSRFPLRLIKAEQLPKPRGLMPREPRGAMWVEFDFRGRTVQLVNTHLGLVRKERLAQIQALLGESWIQRCPRPLILCGDFNAGPKTREYRALSSALKDVQEGSPRKTWFGRYPVRVLDYLFVDGDWKVECVAAPRSALTIEASDHLPLVVDLRLTDGGN